MKEGKEEEKGERREEGRGGERREEEKARGGEGKERREYGSKGGDSKLAEHHTDKQYTPWQHIHGTWHTQTHTYTHLSRVVHPSSW